jgi:uncharacterized protein
MRIAPDIDVDDAALAAICDKYGIAELKVFGSRARGTARPGSDVDVLYTLRPGRKLGWEIEQLADELTNLLGHDVDLVSLRSLHPRIKPTVIAEARPLYAGVRWEASHEISMPRAESQSPGTAGARPQLSRSRRQSTTLNATADICCQYQAAVKGSRRSCAGTAGFARSRSTAAAAQRTSGSSSTRRA